ncbi:MAG: glycerophosphodiester phosphodiesterase family protein [Porticoccaceae bacterium]
MIDPSKLVAHRGYQAKYPENTVLSLNKAIAAGGLFIELDVQFSADKLPIIYHDTNLQRVSGRHIDLFSIRRDKLLTYPACEPDRLGRTFDDQTISPLEAIVDILLANPQVTAFIEIKEESIEHCGRELISASVQQILQPVAAQSVIMSFDYLLAISARQAGWPLVGVVLKNWADLSNIDVISAQPDYIFTDHNIIPADCRLEQVEILADTLLVAYEVSTPALASHLLRQGVDMLETFEIEAMINADLPN